MKLTNDWFLKHKACEELYEWVLKRDYDDAVKTLEELTKISWDWANWTIARALLLADKVKYAKYSAKCATECVEKCAEYAKKCADFAEYAEKCAAEYVEKYAECAEYAAVKCAEYAADDFVKEKIIEYGLKLLKEQEGKNETN